MATGIKQAASVEQNVIVFGSLINVYKEARCFTACAMLAETCHRRPFGGLLFRTAKHSM